MSAGFFCLVRINVYNRGVITRLVRTSALGRVIQYATFSALALLSRSTGLPAFAGNDSWACGETSPYFFLRPFGSGDSACGSKPT